MTQYEELLARVKKQLPEGYFLVEGEDRIIIKNYRDKFILVSVLNSEAPLFASYFMGCYPVISSPRYQTIHNDGAGWNLAYFAMVKTDGIHWRKDAWLLTTEEKEKVINLAKKIINERKYF